MISDHFTGGDRRPGAGFYNEVARAVNRAAELKRSVYNDRTVPDKNHTERLVIDVINITGQLCPCFSVLEIDDPLGRSGNNIDILNYILQHGIIYKGRVPTGGEGRTAVITLNGLRPDEINKAVIMGIVPCAVDVVDVSHRFAKPIAGNTTMLESSGSGNIRLVLEPLQTGVQVVDVMLGFGGAAASIPGDTCFLVTPVSNGFPNRPLVGNALPETTVGFNACRAGLGRLLSKPTGQPLKVYTIDENGFVVPKLDAEDNPLYYKLLTLAENDMSSHYPAYDEQNMPTFNEVEEYGEWSGIAPLYR